MADKTLLQYKEQAETCREVFVNKQQDYGMSWSVYRISSLIDQIFIKTDRIRNIEDGKIPKVEDDTRTEYIGIINYCLITLIQMELLAKKSPSPDFKTVLGLYDGFLKEAMELMVKKNHDYGEAWRQMYVSSFTDIILARIQRIKSILDNKGQTNYSEGIEANLYDMINYAFFALIKMENNR